MRKVLRIVGRILLAVLVLILILLLILSIYNSIMLKREAKLLKNYPGQLVKVDGHFMNVYVQGEGEHTLVFMSGSGTSAPALDFKTLYSRLTDEYRIVVIEKFGYGLSDTIDGDRDFDTILRQDREALEKLGIEGPYVLCPHSMSGLEALIWSQKYPEEVEAVVGLDMSVPEAYEDSGDNLWMAKIAYRVFAAGRKMGLFRLMSTDSIMNKAELTEDEIALYRNVLYRKTSNDTMLRECYGTKAACEEINGAAKPEIPMLLFVSDGSGGSGHDKDTWRGFTYSFTEGMDNAEVVELDCGHYVHDFEYERISGDIRDFLESLG